MLKIIVATYESFPSKLIARYEEKCTMTYMLERGRIFEHFPYVQYETDSRFQTANRLYGLTFTDAKEYYSEKHEGYGCKSEICIHSSCHAPAGIADTALLRRNINWNRAAVANVGDERHGEDT